MCLLIFLKHIPIYVLYLVNLFLLHVSAVYLSHHQVGTLVHKSEPVILPDDE